MNRQHINVHDLPRDVAEERLAGSVAVVIDLLRATSTICQAISSGASEVIPCLEIDEALAVAEAAGRSSVILGGERKGGKISGFDLGNSPCEYTPEVVHGRKVIITTTNGTRALHHARRAKRALAASFLNLAAVVESVRNEPRIDVLCAGTDGEPTREDILAAGAIVSRLANAGSDGCDLAVSAQAACEQWDEFVARGDSSGVELNARLALELRDTQGGRNLLGINLGRDLVDCAQIARLSVVPELDVANWRITA